MRFGVREIANVTFRPLADLDIGRQHFSAYQPCLYIDTATASNMEVSTTTVYAQGGRGNARLIAWEGEKTATFTVTDALLSPISFSMLSGAGVIDKTGATGDKKIVHLTVDGTINSSGNAIEIKGGDVAGYTLKTKSGSEDLNIYAMVLDNNGDVVDYLGVTEIIQPTTEEIAAFTDKWIIKLGDGTASTPVQTAVKDSYKNASVRVDCYAEVASPVTTLIVDAENFGGTFYIEAETLFRDEATGRDFPATFIIPKGKIQGNFTFNMAATGDPSTFDFTIDCTLGTLRTGEAGKVLYAIDIINTISSESHVDDPDNIDIPNPKGYTGAAGHTGSAFTS